MHPSRIFLQIVFFASSSLKSCLHTGFFKIISVEKWAKVCPQMVLFSSALAKCWSKLEHLRPCGVGGCSGQDVMQGGSLQCTAGLDQEGYRSPGWFMGQRPQMSSAVCHRAECPEPLRVKSCMKRKIPSSRVLFSNTNDLLLKDVVTMCLNFLNVAHGFFLPPFFFFSALLS